MLVDMEHVRRNLDNPNVLLVDARGADRYRGENETMDPKGGHIPGALSLPYTENLDGKRYKSAEALKAKFEDLGLDEAEDIVVYCGSGVSASRRPHRLGRSGHQKRQALRWLLERLEQLPPQPGGGGGGAVRRLSPS